MKIEFELKTKEKINIIGIDEKGKRKEIGHIFTPSSSAENNLNAIQICGFDEAFDLWGCGIYGDKETKKMKKDIQLCWHKVYEYMDSRERDFFHKIKDGELTSRKSRISAVIDGEVCGRCFNHPCNCEILVKHENPFTVKREQDLWLEKGDKKSSTSQDKVQQQKENRYTAV